MPVAVRPKNWRRVWKHGWSHVIGQFIGGSANAISSRARHGDLTHCVRSRRGRDGRSIDLSCRPASRTASGAPYSEPRSTPSDRSPHPDWHLEVFRATGCTHARDCWPRRTSIPTMTRPEPRDPTANSPTSGYHTSPRPGFLGMHRQLGRHISIELPAPHDAPTVRRVEILVFRRWNTHVCQSSLDLGGTSWHDDRHCLCIPFNHVHQFSSPLRPGSGSRWPPSPRRPLRPRRASRPAATRRLRAASRPRACPGSGRVGLVDALQDGRLVRWRRAGRRQLEGERDADPRRWPRLLQHPLGQLAGGLDVGRVVQQHQGLQRRVRPRRGGPCTSRGRGRRRWPATAAGRSASRTCTSSGGTGPCRGSGCTSGPSSWRRRTATSVPPTARPAGTATRSCRRPRRSSRPLTASAWSRRNSAWQPEPRAAGEQPVLRVLARTSSVRDRRRLPVRRPT